MSTSWEERTGTCGLSNVNTRVVVESPVLTRLEEMQKGTRGTVREGSSCKSACGFIFARQNRYQLSFDHIGCFYFVILRGGHWRSDEWGRRCEPRFEPCALCSNLHVTSRFLVLYDPSRFRLFRHCSFQFSTYRKYGMNVVGARPDQRRLNIFSAYCDVC